MDVSQYLDIFIDETSEHIQSLSDSIMSLEQEPENDDTVNEIFRAAHSLKGMAGTMGYKRMQHLTHDMENVFQEVRNHAVKVNSTLIDILFDCLDAIEGYLDTVKNTQSEGTEDNEVLIKKLNDFLAGGGEGGGDDAGAGESGGDDAGSGDASAPAEGGDDKGSSDLPAYRQMKLDDETIDKIRKAGESGSLLYGITAHIHPECMLKAARAFLVFKAIDDFGEILAYDPDQQDIEEEKFEFTFSVIIGVNSELDPIVEAISAVSEIDSVEADTITVDMYLNKEEEKAPAEQSAPSEAASEAAAPAPKEEPKEAPKAAPAPKEEKKSAPAAKAADKGKGAAKTNKPVTSRTVRVDIEKLDALMNQVSELIIAKNSLASIVVNAKNDGRSDVQGFHDQIEYLERITTGLHESVMKVRMVPIESTVNKFPRMIRDLSRKLDKPMELVMSGEETELDRTVVDQIGDPLQHLLRNSADHGIESREERAKNNKPEVGNIFLNAYQEGNNVIIQVGDDGGGINTDRVLEKAIERGIVTEEEADELSQKDIIDFLFMPSFSMAKEITDISGRGVGLDVVKSNIEALGGDVEVKSQLGHGSTFTVRLPLTLAIIQALMVEVRDEKYAIALGSINDILDINVEEIRYVQAKEVIHVRGYVIPIIRLDEVLDCEPKEEESDVITVVVVKKGENLAGLVVDNLMGQQEIVIKSIGKVIENNKLISGAAILGDGDVALILDSNAMF